MPGRIADATGAIHRGAEESRIADHRGSSEAGAPNPAGATPWVCVLQAGVAVNEAATTIAAIRSGATKAANGRTRCAPTLAVRLTVGRPSTVTAGRER